MISLFNQKVVMNYNSCITYFLHVYSGNAVMHMGHGHDVICVC
jgi:hypothetical protein